MADIIAKIEADALLLMQAWMHRDAGTLKKLIHRDCTMMFGTHPPQLLDRPSFLSSLDRGMRLEGFKLGEALVKRYNKSVWWSAGAQLDLKLGRTDWSAPFLITDLWRKTAFGGWKLVERSISPTANDDDHQLAAQLRQLQLWR
jgi:hypothetical protein